MQVNNKLLDYTATLSRLNIQPEEREELMESMSEIIEYMEVMNELDTEDTEPMSHVLPLENVFREDRVATSYDRDVLLSNAPSSKDGAFRVPKTVIS